MAIQYYMRGYNTTAPGAVGYVNWIVNDIPDLTGIYIPAPYNSSNITNINVNKIITSKVDNFLKPSQSLSAINNPGYDGYFFHLNSYDWLHSTPPGPPINVPNYLVGISVVRGSNDGIIPRDFATLFWDENNLNWKFAYNINGDGYTIGTFLSVSMGDLFLDGYLSLGTNYAQSGIIRLPNNTFIASRNFNNTNDVYLIGLDVDDRVKLGSPLNSEVYVPGDLRVDGYIRDGETPSISGFIRNSNNTSMVTYRNYLDTLDLNAISSSLDILNVGDQYNSYIMYDSGYGHIFDQQNNNILTIQKNGDINQIEYAVTATFPTITQYSATIGNGQDLKIKSQSTNDVASYGGSIIISSGNGTISDGYVDLRVGEVPKIRIFGINTPVIADYPNDYINNINTIEVFNPIIRWYDTVTSPSITQIYTNASNGQNLSILSQSTIGLGYKGGDLILSSGTSNSNAKDGYVRLQTGQIDRVFINDTSNSVTQTLSVFAFNGLDGSFDNSAVLTPIIKQRDDITNSITGQLMTIQAQNTTGTNTIGGSLTITSGHGSASDGYVRIQTGGNSGLTRMIFDASANRSTLTFNTFAFNGVDGTFDGSSVGAVVNPTITQRDDIQDGVTGQTLTIKSQNVTGANATAGNLILNTGTGTAIISSSTSGPEYTKHGKLFFNAGTNTTYNVGEFFIDGYGPYLSIGGNISYPAAIDGYVRTPNNTWALASARNMGTNPNASIHLIGTNDNNDILIGEQVDSIHITGDLFIGTYGDFTDFNVQNRIIHTNFNIAEPSVIVSPPSLISGLTIHRGNDAVSTYNDEAGWIWSEGSLLNATDGYWKATSILNGDDLTLSNSLNIQARSISVTESTNLTLANNPIPVDNSLPTVGGLRTYNNSTAVSSRDVSGNNNLLLLGTDGYDKIIIGENPQVNEGVVLNTNILGFGSNISNIQLSQFIQDGYGANDGYALHINAQSGQHQTGVNNNNNGGNLLLAGGTAGMGGAGFAGTDGYVALISGNNIIATAGPNKLILNKGYRRHITPVSTTYNILETDDYIAIDASSIYTITLPSSPILGDTYEFKDINGTSSINNITISGNGNNIDGNSDLVLTTDYTSVVITYTGSQWSVR
jgi:hypothetical protein